MNTDRELQTWMADWTADADRLEPPDIVREHVRRRTRLLIVWMTAEFVIAAGFFLVLAWRAVTHPDPIERVVMALLSTICVGALVFSSINWRGVWRPSAETIAGSLQLSRERTRRLQRAVRVGWLVLTAEAVVFAPWVWLRAGDRWWPWAFLAAMLAAGALFLVKSSRWASRESDLLDALARELASDL